MGRGVGICGNQQRRPRVPLGWEHVAKLNIGVVAVRRWGRARLDTETPVSSPKENEIGGKVEV